MGAHITIKSGSVKIQAELNSTRTASAILAALPIKAQVDIWGDEIYFTIPLRIGLDNGQEVVSVGDLGYWPSGPAFCIFFGPTPVSRGNEIRPASAVTVFGKIIGDTSLLKKVQEGAEITIENSAE